jgi:orotate phosphoribosyltransferase
LTSGADPLVIAVSQLANHEGRHLPAFFIRDEQKTHGTERAIEGVVNDGMNVVILDDVMTTGGSILKAIGPVVKRGARVVGVYVLVDREEGGAQAVRDRGYRVESLFTYSELMACGAVPRPSS